MPFIRALSHSPDDTRRIGQHLGERALAGDIICLIGDLGTGKTHLTQGIAAGLGLRSESITSPTYALIAEHPGGRIPLYHMDAYRINDPGELGPIGFDEYISRDDGLLVIEWANRIEDALPDERLQIEMLVTHDEHGEPNARFLIAEPRGKRAESLAQHVFGIF